MHNISVRQWIEKFNNREFVNSDLETQCNAGWYDWFCDESKLAEKTMKLGEMVKIISKSNKINVDTMFVWFKNNCPLYGPLYDDFRFADIETGDTIFTITPNSGHTGLAEVWGKENNFDKEIVIGNMKDVYGYFGVDGFTQYDNYENETSDNCGDEEENDERCYNCGEYSYNCICNNEN